MLRDQISTHCEALAKLTTSLQQGQLQDWAAQEQTRHGLTSSSVGKATCWVPASGSRSSWHRTVNPRVIDEAGMLTHSHTTQPLHRSLITAAPQ